MERFMKNLTAFQRLTIFAKGSILDTWQGSEYASGMTLFVFFPPFNVQLFETSNFIPCLSQL